MDKLTIISEKFLNRLWDVIEILATEEIRIREFIKEYEKLISVGDLKGARLHFSKNRWPDGVDVLGAVLFAHNLKNGKFNRFSPVCLLDETTIEDEGDLK